MKTEDIERIENFCKQEGFEIESYCGGKTVIIGKKDPWEGVEFAACIYHPLSGYTFGKIYPIKEIYGGVVFTKFDDNLATNNGWEKEEFKPSTEQEYVEQLKREAFERFGVIKEGDRFNGVQNDIGRICRYPVWVYHKEFDLLCYGGLTIYQSGKWATKLTERTKVKPINTTLYATRMDNNQEIEIRFESSKPINKSKQEISDFLAKQLEKYLNDEKN